MDVLLAHLSRGDKSKNGRPAKGSRSTSEDSGYSSMSEGDQLQLEKDLRKEAFCREALFREALDCDAIRRARKRWITSTQSPSNTLRPKSLPPVPLCKITPPAFESLWSTSRAPSSERKKPPSSAKGSGGVEVAKTRVRKNATGLEHPRRTLSLLFDQCDGASDELDPFLEPATLRRLKSRSRFSPNTSRKVRPPLKTFATYPTTRSIGSLRTPDRFLPGRRPNFKNATESFRVGKDPNKLSTDEKLLRSKEASPDAFNPRRRVSLPVISPNRPSRSQNRRPVSGGRVGLATILGVPTANQDQIPSSPAGQRQASPGTIWSVGGLAPGVSDGRGRMLSSGSNAPFYTTNFSSMQTKAQQIAEQHEERLSTALNLDRAQRVLEFREPSLCPTPTGSSPNSKHTDSLKTIWTGTEWTMGGREQKVQRIQELRSLPEAPFRVLDAPNLRDDFYCSILAYSSTCHTLAVGLGTILYSWSERTGVLELNGGNGNGAWLTSIAFSSTNGHKSILAFGRSDSTLSLISLPDSLIPRFQVRQMHPIACITWRPTVTIRGSKSPVNPGVPVKTEDLLVGDEQGNIFCYAVEWPFAWEVSRDTWSGCMTLVAKISAHDQQICGLAFSPDGYTFATGGNDNLCCLFKTETVFPLNGNDPEMVLPGLNGVRLLHSVPGEPAIRLITRGAEEYRWVHGAAVKAIAFCPWRDNLLATGGGSNDKCIYFFHTLSGACLAKISVAAQVTSLIWSTTRREIAATFGYAQPEHPYRIAVFSWPECEQIAAIRWEGQHRALYAIAYPGGPNESHRTSREGGSGLTRTAKEGCIVVAGSNESITFHEVWSAGQKATTGCVGLLGGSDILEGLEGVDREKQIIR